MFLPPTTPTIQRPKHWVSPISLLFSSLLTDTPTPTPTPGAPSKWVVVTHRHGVHYEEFTWDRIQTGATSLSAAADAVADNILSANTTDGTDALGQCKPVVLSICGDSVLGLPASAGTTTVGYPAADVYGFLARLCKRLPVVCMTVAELKTSLKPSEAASVGEFLTHALYIYSTSSESAL